MENEIENEVDKPGFDPGGIVDRIDTRDFMWSEVGFGTAPLNWTKGYDIEQELATRLGQSSFKLPIKDQDGSSSCGGQAWATYHAILEAMATGTFEERSAKYVYAQTYQKGGGSYGRDNANILVNQGVARETVTPSYQAGGPPPENFMTRGEDISLLAREDAKPSVTSSYSQTNGSEIDTIAQAIQNNYGVILGVTGSNNGTWSSPTPIPPKIGDRVWRHWIYAGKAQLVNGEKTINCLNSWGLVGDNGWQRLNPTYFNTRLIIDPLTQVVTAIGTGQGAVWSGWTHLFSPPPPVTFTHNFSANILYGQTGSEVKALQRALQLEGISPATVPTTGYFGGITASAVLKFRLKYNISSVTDPLGHSVGKLTRARLNEIYNH